ncbi:uncharacterized protein LOC129565593 [Sitodiplosis mosellana]|uniref:uncharacterized protein LOC129565593 n=1 Tax=Sitodiplosis mosellana TaxID=263140 RepID=UPI0024440BB7|nr:uncharacterized protein LOC129565593 [Sitodiplosis mosellana]
MIQLDSSEIPSEVIRLALHETIENQLKSKDYQINGIYNASKVGETNFVGIVHRVSFKKDGEKKHNELIVKVAPQNAARREIFNSRPFFLREMRMYNEVLPFFRHFQHSKGVAIEENGFVEYPKCYRTIDEEPNESLFFEDLSVRNMAIIDKFTKEVTVDHARMVMKALGKLHALSFALKDQHPEKFKELSSDLIEVHLRPDNAHIREPLNRQSEFVLNLLAAEEDANVLNKMKTLFKREAIYIIGDCLDLESAGSASVIIHGDVWQNNIMFSCDKSGKPIEMCFLDWQCSKHVSPIIDIVYFLFCSTTKELRDVHYEHLLKVYYDSLAAHTRRLGSDVEQLFPHALMQKHFRKFGKYGLILAMLLLPVITADEMGVIDLDQKSKDALSGKQHDAKSYISEKSRVKLNKRLRDVAVDMLNSKEYEIEFVSSASKAGESNFVGIVHQVSFTKEDPNEKERRSASRLILKVAPQNGFSAVYGISFSLRSINKPVSFGRIIATPLNINTLNQNIVSGYFCRENMRRKHLLALINRNTPVSKKVNQMIVRFAAPFAILQSKFLLTEKREWKDTSEQHDTRRGKSNKLSNDDVTLNLKEIFVRTDDDYYREFFNKHVEVIFKVLKHEEDAHLLDEMKNLFEKEPIAVAVECLDLNATRSASVISHGDAWQNNAMFRHDENRKSFEICLLDWQILRHSSPAIDVAYFIFGCTTKELRDLHYEQFSNIYYDSLSTHIRRLGSDPDKLFPFTLMQQHLQQFAKYALVLCTVLLLLLTADRGNEIDLDQIADNIGDNKDTEVYGAFISESS